MARSLKISGTRGNYRRHIIPHKLLEPFKANGIRLVRIDFGKRSASRPEKAGNNSGAANTALQTTNYKSIVTLIFSPDVTSLRRF